MSAAEWSVYCRGYYRALAAALASMELAARNFTRATRERQRAARLAAVAARRSVAVPGVADGKLGGVPLDDVTEAARERADVLHLEYEGLVAETFVSDAYDELSRGSIEVDSQLDLPGEVGQLRHPASLPPAEIPVQLLEAHESVSNFDRSAAPLHLAGVGGAFGYRTGVRDRLRPRQRKTSKPKARRSRG